MKFHSLNRNTRFQNQPPGTYPYAKNGIRILGVNQNEPGFILSPAVVPYTTIGVIETDKYPIHISTNNVNSAIGYHDTDNEKYIPIFDDTNKPYKLGLNTEYPVNGQAQRNYKGEIVIAFTDNHTFPKFLNCDKPVVDSIDDWRLFVKASIPTLTVVPIDGGILSPGAYYILAKYHKNDGTETSFVANSDAILLEGEAGTSTGKSLETTLENLDPNYDLVQLGIITKIGGIVRGFTLAPVTIGTGGKVTIVYSGANITAEVALEELLVQPVSYDKVASIGQLNDALYLLNLEREPEINMQKHLLLAKLEWVSDLISVNPRNEEHASGKRRSLLHREVYCFYVRLSKTGGGGWTRLFPLPGPEPVPGDLLQSSEATIGGLTAKVFQVEDTIRSFDPVSKTGTCGVWVNDDETYPDTPDYDASGIGGPNLRGQKVRFHRMPSLKFCKAHLYTNDVSYGRDKLDLLGLRLTNLVIPQELSDKLDGGYEIYYAKRSLANSTVIAQSALIHSARHGGGAGATTISGPDLDYKSTGGNWNAEIDWDGSNREKPLVVDRSLFRFHSFDLLVNKPVITPRYMSQELKLRHSNLPMIEDYTFSGGRQDAPIVYLADYVSKGMVSISESGKLVRKIRDTNDNPPQYATNNLITGKWYNVQLETAYVGKLEGPLLLDPSEIAYSHLWTGPNAQRPDKAAQFEVTYLSNLMNLPENLYLPFNGQSVVRMGPRQTAFTPIFGGDVFVCDYTFHTYGWHEQDNKTYARDSAKDPFMGIKVVRRIAVESASNIYNRFEQPGNMYSKWYPNSPLVKDDNTNYISLFDRRVDPNQIGYDKSSNSLNDIITAEIFNPQEERLNVFPFRIHRGGKLNRQLKTRSWRSFHPLDYYEMQKNMGVGVHIEGMDDRLLIHMENALFYTRPKLNLEQGDLSVIIGNGDIFDFEPQETYSAKLGYAGTQHNLACVRTPAGYVFTDSKQGQIFIFKGQLKLLNGTLDKFFQAFLKRIENNPFVGNGITIGYDQDHNRILLTFKNKITPAGVKPLQRTQEFIDSLTPGVSLVSDKGVVMRFLGENTSPDYTCSDKVPVHILDVYEEIPETTPFGTAIRTIVPVSGENLSFYILSGNIDNAFSLDASTGILKVNNPAAINFETRDEFVMQAKAVSANELEDTFTITIKILNVNEPPRSGNQEYFINETAPNGLQFGIINATDPDSDPLSFSIVSGDDEGVFIINAVTGAISIADNSTLDAETTPVYLLTVAISDGINVINIQVIVNVQDVNEPPPLDNDSITIDDSTETGTVVYQFQTQDPEGDEVVYELVSESIPGVFALNPTTGEITLVDNNLLDPVITPQYTLVVKVSDINGNSDTGTLVINIRFDMEEIEFRPSSPSCSGGCPVGFDQSTDGQWCERFTRIPATPPTGGPPFAVVPARDGSYSNFGAIIYQPGFNQQGVGTVQQWMQTPTWRNAGGNLVDGPLNRCGVWSSAAVPNNEPIGFSVPIVLAARTTVFVAIAGDNRCRIAIDGVTLVDQDPVLIGTSLGAQIPQFNMQGISLAFKFWHIYPFELDAGTRFIGMEGVNFGSAAGFGAEIYANTSAELLAATLLPAYTANPNAFPLNQNHYGNLNLLFSTRSTRGGTFSSGITGGFSCPVGMAMDGSQNPPQCVLVERVASKTRIWSTVEIWSLRTNTRISTVQNVAGLTFQGRSIPNYPAVQDHIDCGGSVQTYYNTAKSGTAQKDDCTEGTGTIVKYAVPKGAHVSTVSQLQADAIAEDDVAENRQAFANSNGTCITDQNL